MPTILTARQLGLDFANLFGELGPERTVTGHHTAGPKDASDAHAIQLCRGYHAQHRASGWGGMGYHFNVTRRGTIICLRPLRLKGAHVGGWNTSNVGVMFHGTTGDRPTLAQARAFRWLLANLHTAKMPRAHRADRSVARAPRYGHNDWDGHESNACPGTHKTLIRTRYRGSAR